MSPAAILVKPVKQQRTRTAAGLYSGFSAIMSSDPGPDPDLLLSELEQVELERDLAHARFDQLDEDERLFWGRLARVPA